jgi:hypothetical protein
MVLTWNRSDRALARTDRYAAALVGGGICVTEFFAKDLQIANKLSVAVPSVTRLLRQHVVRGWVSTTVRTMIKSVGCLGCRTQNPRILGPLLWLVVDSAH